MKPDKYEVERLDELEHHDRPFHMFSEHGTWWITYLPCGATWAIRCTDESSDEPLQLEEIFHGDETCPSEEQ